MWTWGYALQIDIILTAYWPLLYRGNTRTKQRSFNQREVASPRIPRNLEPQWITEFDVSAFENNTKLFRYSYHLGRIINQSSDKDLAHIYADLGVHHTLAIAETRRSVNAPLTVSTPFCEAQRRECIFLIFRSTLFFIVSNIQLRVLFQWSNAISILTRKAYSWSLRKPFRSALVRFWPYLWKIPFLRIIS